MSSPASLRSIPSPDHVIALFENGVMTELSQFADAFMDHPYEAINRDSMVKVAVACAMTEKQVEAARLFSLLSEAEPQEVGHRMNLAVLHMSAGRAEEAYALLGNCLQEQPGNLDVVYNLGLATFALGRFHEARAHLLSVLRASPDHQTARLYLARSCAESGDFELARSLCAGYGFEQVGAGIREHYEMSRLYSQIDEPERAEDLLRQLIEKNPAEIDARINLAALLERANRNDEAMALLDPLTDTDRKSAHYLTTLGSLQAAAKHPERALETFQAARRRAEAQLDGLALQQMQSQIAFGAGHALDKLGRHDEAFEAFQEANQLIRDHFRHYHPARTDAGERTALISDTPELDAPVVAAADASVLTRAETPIFLVGFPRSGTTLLDQILDAHPQLQVLEEKPAIDTVAAALDDSPRRYPSMLEMLGEADAAALRKLYWQTVSKFLPRRPESCLVDKYPLNLARLHLIMRLFPRAKWIFAIRHPCDVVLSCFMQNFRFTESTHGFWSIEQTASIYEQIMGLWLAQRERLKPDCFDLRYEDLIADVEGSARRLLRFLDLPWDDKVLGHAEHAKTRRISTPSYNQVTQPIYKTAQGRWRAYEKYFGTALPMLEPFIERFGYAK